MRGIVHRPTDIVPAVLSGLPGTVPPVTDEPDSNGPPNLYRGTCIRCGHVLVVDEPARQNAERPRGPWAPCPRCAKPWALAAFAVDAGVERRHLAPVPLEPVTDAEFTSGPNAAAGFGDPGELTRLTDVDSGVFEVRTVTSWYVIDLDARALHRLPATILPDDTMAETAIVYHFHIDGGWLPLVELHQCELGERMRATVHFDDQDQPLRSTLVRSIRPYRTSRTPGT
jgi:hypothetical protein